MNYIIIQFYNSEAFSENCDVIYRLSFIKTAYDLDKFNLVKLGNNTERFTDLGKLWWFDFRLEPIYITAPAASNMMFGLKVIKIDSKIIISLH